MKKKSIVLISAGVIMVVGIFLATIGTFMGGVNTIYFDSDGVHTVNERNGESKMAQDIGSFENIDISLISGEIELIKSDRNAVEYDLLGQEKLEICEVRNGTFVFKTKSKFSVMMWNFKSPYIKLYYKDGSAFDNVSLTSTSGSVNVDGLNAKTVSVTSISGRRELSNITAQKLVIDGTSGSVQTDNIKSNSIELRTVSGRIAGINVSCDNLVTKNTSGSINISNLTTNSTDIRGSSGSVTLQGALSGKTYISNISGSVKISPTLPKDDYGFKLSSTSGTTKIDGEKFSGTMGTDKPNFIEIKTTSGGIGITFN